MGFFWTAIMCTAQFDNVAAVEDTSLLQATIAKMDVSAEGNLVGETVQSATQDGMAFKDVVRNALGAIVRQGIEHGMGLEDVVRQVGAAAAQEWFEQAPEDNFAPQSGEICLPYSAFTTTTTSIEPTSSTGFTVGMTLEDFQWHSNWITSDCPELGRDGTSWTSNKSEVMGSCSIEGFADDAKPFFVFSNNQYDRCRICYPVSGTGKVTMVAANCHGGNWEPLRVDEGAEGYSTMTGSSAVLIPQYTMKTIEKNFNWPDHQLRYQICVDAAAGDIFGIKDFVVEHF